MTIIRLILLPILFSFFLASCNGSDPTAVDDAGAPSPVENNPVDETKVPAPTTIIKATVTLTAEPTPEVEEMETMPTGEPTQSSEPEPTAIVVQPGVEDVSIPGADGLLLQATLYTPEASGPLPGVMLLHMLGSDRRAWEDTGLTAALVDSGYAVLAVDMRGHGDTGSSIDWQKAPEDLQLVWDYFTALETVDRQRTAVIGASIGANLALHTVADQPAIQTVILLSPGLDYRGVATEDPINKQGERPILIVASEEDAYSADSSRTLASLVQGESQLELYNGAGHGTRMFTAQPELTALILTWLNQKLN